jgi:hypothetical protein
VPHDEEEQQSEERTELQPRCRQDEALRHPVKMPGRSTRETI